VFADVFDQPLLAGAASTCGALCSRRFWRQLL
jgi:hypothetical protein